MTDKQMIDDASRLKSIYERRKLEHRDRGKKFSQEVVADMLGMTQGAVGHYLNGRSPLNLESALKFADVFNVPVSDFSPSLARLLEMSEHDDIDIKKFIDAPVLNYRQAVDFRSYINKGIIEDIIPYNKDKHSGSCYWIRVEDNSMQPDFNEGDMLLADPEMKAHAGTYVIALKAGGEEIVVRRYRPRGYDEQTMREYFQLISSNDMYPVIDSRFTPFKILSVAVVLKKSLI